MKVQRKLKDEWESWEREAKNGCKYVDRVATSSANI